MAPESSFTTAMAHRTARPWSTALLGALLTTACGSDSARSNDGHASGGNGAAVGDSGTAASGGLASAGGAGATSGAGDPSGTANRAGATANSNGGHDTDAGSGGNAGNANDAGGRNGAGGSGGHDATGSKSGRNDAGGTTSTGGTISASGTSSGGSGGSGELDHEIQGVYCGNSTDAVTQFENWFGKPTGGILGYTGSASWQDFDGSVGWATGLWSALDRRVLWSVPLIPTGATLSDAAAGMYDDHYKKAAQTLATYRPQENVLYVRTGWEFNGDWFPWSALDGKAKDFAGAFQHFVAAFRSVSPRFRFEWNVNLGDSGMNPEDAYPGDESVDIIGMDFYWNLQYDAADPNTAWNSKLTQKYGLQWHQDLAAAHHKPTAYSEWGIMSDQAGPYIRQAKAWFAAHDVVHQSYWNSNTAFGGMLSGGQYPNAGAAYKAAFGQ